jgi:hypothetical protein
MKTLITFTISLVLLTSLAFSSDTDPEQFKPKQYDDAKVLRVKYTQGESFVRRSYDEGLEEAAVNLPIFEKDTAGTTDGRLEIYLGRLNYLRLDNDSEVVFDKVPELRKTNLTINVIKGGIYLDIENLDFERDIQVQTADCGVFLLDKGLYRINVSAGGKTEVYVYDGIAEVAGSNYNRNVRENQKIVMFDGRVKERPFYFYSSDTDGFDKWNRDRNNVVGYARYSSSRYLDEGYEDYEYELSRNGRWQYSSTYGTNIWIPYSVGLDWRPYYNGRWVYSPYYGYVWSSYDTWGFFTHHYGRWHWDPILHWYWLPGYHWSPGWVSWFWDDYYYGWCPLSWWNRPVIVYNGRWWRNYRYWRGIPHHTRSTTIIKKSMLSSSSIRKAALKKGVAGKIAKNSLAFKGNGPGIRPRHDRVKVINAKGKTVIYKRGGIVSKNKYKLVKTTPDGKKVVSKTAVYKYSGKRSVTPKISKYSKSPYMKSPPMKSKTYKFKSYKSPGSSNSSGTVKSTSKYKPSKYKYRPSTGSSKGSKSSSSSGYKYRPRSSSSRTKSSSKPKSGYKSSGSKSKSSKSKSSRSKSSSKVKKKKESPSYSYMPYRSSGSYSGSSSSSRYASSSRYSPKKNTHKYYSPSTTTKKRTYSSSYGSSSYGSSSHDTAYKPRSSSSYRSSYKPSSSYKSSYKSSYGSRPSRSSSSYKSSYKPKSSRSSSSRSSSRSSRSSSSSSRKSSSSSSKSYKKK